MCSFVASNKPQNLKSVFLPDKKKNEAEELESIDGRQIWFTEGQGQRSLATPQDGQFPSQNEGHVKFEIPRIPVIFVLGMVLQCANKLLFIFIRTKISIGSK